LLLFLEFVRGQPTLFLSFALYLFCLLPLRLFQGFFRFYPFDLLCLGLLTGLLLRLQSFLLLAFDLS
jgi:hypothetical protein